MNRRSVRFLQGIISDRSGYSLVELIVSITVLTSVAAGVTVATFQILTTQNKWRDEALATKDLRALNAVFASDVLLAATTTLDDLSSASSTSLIWTDVNGVTSTATFLLVGAAVPYTLQRTITEAFGTATTTVQKELASKVVTSTFSRSGKTMTFAVGVQGFQSAVRTTTLQAWMRNAD